MSGERYKIATLDDIARIPDDVLPRFISELPGILKAREQVREAIPSLAATMKANAPGWRRHLPLSWFRFAIGTQLLANGTWVDDDKGTITVTMGVRKGDEPFFKQTEKLP